jgi:flagellar biosynthesis/type III secretory pathway M-ring protein FliF/YscJ
VTVSGLQFSPELEAQQKQSLDMVKQSNQQELIMSLAQLLGLLILGVGSLFVFYKLLHRPVTGHVVEEELASYPMIPMDDVEPLLATTTIPALEAKLDPELEYMREAINGMIVKDPAEAARVLVTYMKDMSGG